MNKLNIIYIILWTCVSISVSELINWFFGQHSEKFKKLTAEIDRVKEKIEKGKENVNSGSIKNKATQKKHEETLDALEKSRSGLNFKAMIANVIFNLVFFSTIYRTFDGQVVALLPFEPVLFFRSIFHKSIQGENYYECGVMGFYFLCNHCLKNLATKIFNLKSATGASPFNFQESYKKMERLMN